MKKQYEKTLGTITDTISANTVWRYTLSDVVFDLKNNISKYDWVGIYLYEDGMLTLETFLGQPTEHTKIELPNGVCGESAAKRETLIVDDVCARSNYISCSIRVKSEIVVPIIRGNELLGVIDIDSHTKAAFNEDDRELLEKTAVQVAAKAPFVQKSNKL